MASKKDMRREDLIIPFVEPDKGKPEGDMQSTIASTIPMAAIFLRNRVMAWVAVTFTLQHWLSESAEQKRGAATPAYVSFGMSIMSLLVGYLPLFMPPPQMRGATGTQPQQPVPQS